MTMEPVEAQPADQYPDNLPEALRSDIITARVIRDRVWRPPNMENNWAAFCMVGREGSGKSMTTASILEKADPTFSADRVFFSPEKLVEWMASLTKEERTGKAAMLDEAGVGMGVRSWYDKEQIKVNKAAQTMRDDNMILAMTLPSFGGLDSQMRSRMHGFCEMRGLRRGDHATWSWKDIQVNREEQGNEIRLKTFPRYRRNGRVQRVSRLKIGPPSDEFIAEYEARKKEFKQQLYDEVAGNEEEDVEDDKPDPQSIAREIIDDDRIDEMLTLHGGWNREYVDSDKIYMAYPELSQREAQMVRKLVAEEWEPEGDE